MKVKKIIWNDASSIGLNGDNEWMSIEMARELGKKIFDRKNVSTGFILEKNKKFIVVCATQCGNGDFADCSMIPTKNIEKIINCV